MTTDQERDDTPPAAESDATWIDRICDAFEQAWREGKEPRIEDFLGDAGEPLRTRLFEELLLSDLECHARSGRTISVNDYVSRFPDRTVRIRAVITDNQFDIARRFRRGDSAFEPPPCKGESTTEQFPEGTPCGAYRLLHEVARGGMGIVFKAYDTKLQRTVALKMILDRNLASPEAVQRFYAEAEMAAGLNHPGIVPVYDVGSHAGHHYYVMGLVEGPTLSQELARRQFSVEEATQLVLNLAHAIAHAHQHGVIHRDLKPGNILLADNGTPQITDFGLAKRTDRPSEFTVAGQILGTPGYMAPEQAAGDVSQSGEPVDIYALGAILYHVLTGHPPFRTALDALVCVLEQDPVPPRVLSRRVPRDLNIICMKCLSKNPADRYESARQLADDLHRFLQGELIQAKPSSVRRRVLRWARHRPRLAAVWVTMAAFYLYHLICLAAGNPGSRGFFHVLATGATALVCLYAWWFQILIMRPAASSRILYAWVGIDLLALTLFLMVAADGAQSPLIVIYLCMVASAALSFDRHLVWWVTGVALVSYQIVVFVSPWLRPEVDMPPFRQVVPTAIGIVAIGLVQYFVLRCARVYLPHSSTAVSRPEAP
jgi:eukaryotic-like serine/threonine-protein kinase